MDAIDLGVGAAQQSYDYCDIRRSLLPEKAEEYVVRAFLSMLRRERFFGVPDDERLSNF